MKRLLIIIKGDQRFFFPKIAEALAREHGCSVSAVVFSTPAERLMRSLGFFEEVHNVAAFLRNGASHEIAAFDEQAEPGLAMAVYGDRILRTYPFEQANSLVAGLHAFWSKVYREAKPDAVFGEIACAAEWIGSSLARQAGVLYLCPYHTPVSDRFFFITEPQGLWDRMAERYDEYRAGRLPAGEYQAAADFIERFRASKLKPQFLAKSLASPSRFRARPLLKRLGRVPYRLSVWREDGRFDVGSYEGTAPWKPVVSDLNVHWRYPVHEARYFDAAPPPGPKAYFPLHMQPEFTTDVRTPFYVNQPAVIEAIAKSLPLGHRLIVKEHPAMKGQREGSYYQSIRRCFNVRMVSPSADSHDLIRQSELVFTINGSTGWESILYEKPVICFGRLCYHFFDSLYFCDNLKDLPNLVRQVRREFRPRPDQLVRFVAALLSSAYTGRIANGIDDAFVMSRENVSGVAAAIHREMAEAHPGLRVA